MRVVNLLAAIFILSLPAVAWAQEDAPDEPAPPPRLHKWLSDHGVSIRKTFDGSKNEAKPASILWVNDRGDEDDSSAAAIDVAVKVTEWDLLPDGPSQFVLYPTMEWHRLDSGEKPLDTVSAAINFEYRPFLLRQFTPEGNIVDTGLSNERTISPVLLFSAEGKRDLEENQTEDLLRLLVTLTSNKAGYPGADFRGSDGAFKGRYYPYLGVEHVDLGSGEDSRATLGLARFYLEYWPIASFSEQYLQLVAEYTYRYEIDGSLSKNSDLDDLVVGLNFYLDGRGNFAIGYEYARGEDPKDKFKFRQRSTVGLKVKF